MRGSASQTARDIICVARPDHWFKNLFLLFGAAIALPMAGVPIDGRLALRVTVAFACACLVASFNYIVNEVLDAPRDRLHPTKCERAIACGRLHPAPAMAAALVLLAGGLAVGYLVLGAATAASLGLLALLGVLYNVPPIRLKDRALLDAISESANNPTRLLIGWYGVGAAAFPPSSVILAYWAIGAFLMTAKRYAELRFIGDREQAAAYRSSFAWYSEEKLLLLMIMYVAATLYLVGVLTAKYHPELILSMPLLCIFVGWFFHLAREADSVVKEPERITRRPAFLAYSIALVVVLVALAAADMPWVEALLGLQGRPW